MKTVLHNMKTKIAATALAILGFGAINAQTCAVSGVPTYNGNGATNMMIQVSFPAGWVSSVNVTYGDGANFTGNTSASFYTTTHNYNQNGMYGVVTNLYAYDPNDSMQYCSVYDVDTLVINDMAPSGGGSCNMQVTVSAYGTSDSTVNIFSTASNPYTYSYITVDGQFFPNVDSMDYTFTQAGAHDVCYYADYSDSTTFCYDSTCIIYTSAGPNGGGGTSQCQAAFYLWQDSTNVLGNGWLAINYSSGAGALTYAWDFGDGNTSTQAYPMHTYNTPGNYIICLSITDANGCSSSTCDSSAALRMIQSQLSTNAIIGSLTVSAPTGIADHKSVVLSSSVAPNPMANATKVSFESEKSMKGKIEIVNVLGEVAFSQEININNGANAVDINTENITNGIYFLKISSDNKTLSTIKVVK